MNLKLLRKTWLALTKPYRKVVGTLRRKRRERLKAMKRDRQLMSMISDIITWGVEEAVYQGKMSRMEATQKYLEFAAKMDLVDLLPRKRELTRKDIYNLKKAIKSRLPDAETKLAKLRTRSSDNPESIFKLRRAS